MRILQKRNRVLIFFILTFVAVWFVFNMYTKEMVKRKTEPDPGMPAGRKIVTVKNGTFYLDNVPTFLVGPFLGYGLADLKTPRPGIEQGHPLYPLYTEILNARSAKLIGFNSAQTQLPTYFLAEKLAPELLERQPGFKANVKEANIKPYEQFFKD